MTGERIAVLHVSDRPEDVDRAVAAAGGLRESMPDVRVRIIVNGEALNGVSGGAPVEAPDGVEVLACSIGLGKRSIPTDSLRPGVEVHPSAAVALVEAQLDGAAYIRL